MERYEELMKQKKLATEGISIEKKRLNKEFRKNNKKRFIFMDVLFVLIILFNFGAVVLTNVLVVKETPAMQFYEANILQKELMQNDYEIHPDAQEYSSSLPLLFNSIMKQAIMWALLAFVYLLMRFTMFTYNKFYWVLFFLVLYFMVTGIDFFNNFGFFIGKLVYGG